MCVRAALILFLGAVYALASASAQQDASLTGAAPSAPAETRPHAPFFSGLVTDLKPESISVTRKGAQGRRSVERVFVIDSQTKVDGKLKLSARVTVHYETAGANQRALRIIVRPAAAKP